MEDGGGEVPSRRGHFPRISSSVFFHSAPPWFWRQRAGARHRICHYFCDSRITQWSRSRNLGGDALFHVQSLNHEVMIPGYENEPYLKITKDNKVFVNDGSTTAFLNGSRYGNVDLSQFSKTDDPQWRLIATDGSAMWHDHRVH